MSSEIPGIVLGSEQLEGSRRRFDILIGPQHPGSGHMRLLVEVEGDVITRVEPDPGYVHRTMEKLGETRLWIQNLPLFERMSLPDAINVTWGYIMAVEKLLGFDVSERAQYLRVIMAELSRISTHLYDIAIHGIFIGSSTVFMWALGLRELLVDLWVLASGARTTPSWVIPGGVRMAPPDAFYEKAIGFLNFLERKLVELERLMIKNPAGLVRLKEVGVLTREDAAKLGAVGPAARGSGIDWDARKVYRYSIYDRFEWDVVVEDSGDALARTLVRIGEIRQSARIIRQAIRDAPRSGPLVGDALLHRMPPQIRQRADREIKFAPLLLLKPGRGEGVGLVEGGRGIYYYHVFSDGGDRPFRVRIITPSWRNLMPFMRACIGARLMDLPSIYGSFGYFPPEADR